MHFVLHQFFTQQHFVGAESHDTESPWQMQYQQSKCDNVLLKSCRLCREIKYVDMLIKWKRFPKQFSNLSTEKYDQPNSKDSARCHGESQQDQIAGVFVYMFAQEGLKLCQFQTECSHDDVSFTSTYILCLCVTRRRRGEFLCEKRAVKLYSSLHYICITYDLLRIFLRRFFSWTRLPVNLIRCGGKGLIETVPVGCNI